ncbi:hypothetical protein HPB50_008992 [Hyalomma asiaticum]|uniref:Uncharacterized protein n=1 Tax=Hyalomma asiaticum TaxID=266040 RepID=A0ACB7RU60_HYAAI|nr:hypothetical protein HPB50_008992 [Hyalomma asiaticum]
MCIALPGAFAAYHGKLIGTIRTYYHELSGTVYAATARSVVITHLNYDGMGPAAHFWAGLKSELDYNGDQLLDEEQSTKVLKAYTNATVFLRLPRKVNEYRSLGVFCELFGADFGNVKIPEGYELPKEHSLGKLSSKQHNTKAAEVILKDSATMLLKGFEYDASCPGSAFLVSGPTANTKPDQLTYLIHENGKSDTLKSYDKKDVTVTLPVGHNWNEFRWFSVYCSDSKESYADIAIDQAAAEKLPLHDPKSVVPLESTEPESTDNNAGVLCAYYGKLIGQIVTQAHSFSGTVYAASDKSIIITNLNYDGNGPAAFFWASTKADRLELHDEQLPDEHGSTNVLKAYHNAVVLLKLPRKITEYKAIGMYCKAAETEFGHVTIKDFKLPTAQSLGKLTAKQHNTMANEVILTDSATMVLKGFEYGASCPGSAFFVAGPSADPKPEQLTHLLHDNGQSSKLGSYDKKDVTIRLPAGHHWNEFKWFSVYCSDAKQSYADVSIKQSVAEMLPLHDPTKVPPPSEEEDLRLISVALRRVVVIALLPVLPSPFYLEEGANVGNDVSYKCAPRLPGRQRDANLGIPFAP